MVSLTIVLPSQNRPGPKLGFYNMAQEYNILVQPDYR